MWDPSIHHGLCILAGPCVESFALRTKANWSSALLVMMPADSELALPVTEGEKNYLGCVIHNGRK